MIQPGNRVPYTAGVNPGRVSVEDSLILYWLAHGVNGLYSLPATSARARTPSLMAKAEPIYCKHGIKIRQGPNLILPNAISPRAVSTGPGQALFSWILSPPVQREHPCGRGVCRSGPALWRGRHPYRQRRVQRRNIPISDWFWPCGSKRHYWPC
jgi:hypothetical protein